MKLVNFDINKIDFFIILYIMARRSISIYNQNSNGSLSDLVYERYPDLDVNLIKHIKIFNCQITNIDIKFPNIETMMLIGNLITKMENLDNLNSLRSLFLSYNRITEIGNLENCDNLQKIDLRNNLIENIENLNKINKTKLYINLSNNKIKEIKNFPDNTFEILLKNNLIECIENLPKNLCVLNVSGNDIKEIKNINFNLMDLKYDSTVLPKMSVSDILYIEFNKIIEENKKLNDRVEYLEEKLEMELLKPDSLFIKELAKIYHETGEFKIK